MKSRAPGKLLVTVSGSYVLAFTVLGVMAIAAALLLAAKVPSDKNQPGMP